MTQIVPGLERQLKEHPKARIDPVGMRGRGAHRAEQSAGARKKWQLAEPLVLKLWKIISRRKP